jgi:Ecdysteroid kinase-like family
MNADLARIAKAIDATSVRRGERIQSLWSGYGEIFRIEIEGGRASKQARRAGAPETAIVKSVKPPAQHGASRDRGGPSESRSHARKCRSYDVEMAWYRRFASSCDNTCRVPKLLASEAAKDQWTFVLEDLDAAGFSERSHDPSPKQIEACLSWIAAFHAQFLGSASGRKGLVNHETHAPEGRKGLVNHETHAPEGRKGLWKSGTYWHLATRPDELAAIEDDALRAAAPLLDRKLRDCSFQTLVHGDAKPANFCFAPNGSGVAAVDFQYVGGGCGMKDVAYFLYDESMRDDVEARCLDFYFARLREAVALREDAVDVDALEREWRGLYPVAKVDFFRFLAGWSKAHWRNQTRAQRITRDLLRALEK